jgi:hypothetical protein
MWGIRTIVPCNKAEANLTSILASADPNQQRSELYWRVCMRAGHETGTDKQDNVEQCDVMLAFIVTAMPPSVGRVRPFVRKTARRSVMETRVFN